MYRHMYHYKYREFDQAYIWLATVHVLMLSLVYSKSEAIASVHACWFQKQSYNSY